MSNNKYLFILAIGLCWFVQIASNSHFVTKQLLIVENCSYKRGLRRAQNERFITIAAYSGLLL